MDMNVIYIVFCVMDHGYVIFILFCVRKMEKTKKRKIFPALPSATLDKFAMTLGKARQK